MANTTNTVGANTGALVLAAGTVNLSGAITQVIPVYATAMYQGLKFIATDPGTGGNSIYLTFDGISTVNTVVSVWNAMHPTLTCQNDINNQVLIAGTASFAGGTNELPATHASAKVIEGMQFMASNPGVSGNYIHLVFDGFQTVGRILYLWNVNNVGNQCYSNALNQILPAKQLTLSGGTLGEEQVVVLDEELGIIAARLNEKQTLALRQGYGQNIDFAVEFGPLRKSGVGWNRVDVVGG